MLIKLGISRWVSSTTTTKTGTTWLILFITQHLLPLTRGRHASCQGKREEEKTIEKNEKMERDRGTEGEAPNPILAIDEIIGEEE